MPNEVMENADETKQMIIKIENELARLALTSMTPEAQQSVKVCVYHIILRAISLAKDPKTNVGESKKLFELAQEIIAEAGLEESDLKGRLADLINAMVDQDDLAIQFRFYRLQNSEYFKTVFDLIRNESALKTEEFENLQGSVNQIRSMITTMSKRKNVLRLFLVSFFALAVLLFTIISSVVIIMALLAGNPTSPNPNTHIDKSSLYKQEPIIEKVRE